MRGIFGVLALTVLSGCSSDPEVFGDAPPADAGPDSSQVCEPGKQVDCACPGGSAGAQRCRDDGSGWEACICPDASLPPQDAADGADEDTSPEASNDVASDGPGEVGEDVDAAGDVEAETDAPELCPYAEARSLTCSMQCAHCVQSMCEVECSERPDLGGVIQCHCGCPHGSVNCVAECDAVWGEIQVQAYVICVQMNCPPECDFMLGGVSGYDAG